MSLQSTHQVGSSTFAGEIARWALPRLGIYVTAAIGSMLAFTAWAAIYTYVWPGKSSPAQVPEIVAPPPAPPPASRPKSEGALLSSIDPGALSVTRWYKGAVYDPSNNKTGEIIDVLIDRSGKVTAFIVGVGGFLGIGEKDVAIPFNAVQDTKGHLVVAADKDALKNARGFRYNSGAMAWVPEEYNPMTTGTPATPAAPEQAPARP